MSKTHFHTRTYFFIQEHIVHGLSNLLARRCTSKHHAFLFIIPTHAPPKSGTIAANPLELVDRPEPRKDEEAKDEAEAYTADEVRYILKCLSEEPLKWRLMVRLLVDTGMRRGECCGLQWENVDFVNNTITVFGNLCYTPQKGVYLDTSKNRRRRKIDVDPTVMFLMKQQRQAQTKKVISPYVFTKEDSAEPMHPQSPTRYLKKFEKKYGVDHLHPHKLRHSFASIAITSGADVASVSEKIGHRDKATTLRMYTHANEDSIKKAGNIFREAIKEA